MSKNAYEILGVKEDASKAEIDEAYYALRTKYRNDMYQEGALGKAAAQKLNEVEQAYSDISSGRATPRTDMAKNASEQSVGGEETKSKHAPAFAAVEAALKAKDYRAAQDALDQVGTRDAEWHYFQAVIYYNKGWMSEAKNQMEMACNMDGDNQHYKNVLSKLNATIENANQSGNKGYNQSTQQQASGNGYQRSYAEQDARAAEDSCCRWCQTMICLNCLCDCCCRG